MKFVNLHVRTGESVKNVAFNIDAIQRVEQLIPMFPHELTEQQQSAHAHRAVMAYDSYKGQYICKVRYPHLHMNITVAEDCQAVYLITLKNGDVYICQDGDMPVSFVELLGF